MSENRLFLSGEENKYSSAVAIASIVKYLEQFISILLVTSASNLPVRTIRFCSVIFGVTSNQMIRYDSVYLTCNKKQTGNQLSCTRFGVVYSARQRLVGLALQVIARGAWWANTRIGLPAKPTTGAIYNQVESVIGRKARLSLRIEILAYPTCIRRPS